MTRAVIEKLDPSPAARGTLPTVLAIVGVALIALMAHGRALPHPFVLDDQIVIVQDPRVANCDAGAIFSQEYWPGESGGNRVWRPLTTLSLALQWQIAPSPTAFRAVNLLIHICSGVSLLLLARTVLGSTLCAFVAAAIYVAHPLHTTPLNQIVDRADLLATMLTLTACNLAIREFAAPSVLRSVVTALCAAGAVLCKESAIAVAAIVPALHIWLARASNPRPLRKSTAARLYALLVAAIAAALIWRAGVLGGVGRAATEINPLDNILANPAVILHGGESITLARWGTPIATFAVALGKFVWPHPLSWDYSTAAIDVVRSGSDPRFTAGIAALAVALVAAFLSLRRTRTTFVSLAIAIASYAVVSNVIVLIGALFAERYMNLAAAGLSMLVVHWANLAVAYGARARADRVVLALLSPAIVALCVLSFVRHGDFASPTLLDAVDLARNPNSARLWCSRASDAVNARNWRDAITSAERAIAIIDTDPRPHRLLGLACFQLRDFDRALAEMQRAISLGDQTNENAVTIATQILKSRANYADAITLLNRYFDAGGRSPNLRNNLAWYLVTATPAALRDPPRAVTLAKAAFESQPAEPDFADTYVEALLATGDRETAKAVLKRLLAALAVDDPQRRAFEDKLAALQQ